MTRVNKVVTQMPIMKIGAGGNYYVLCTFLEPLKKICREIEKSTNSIYYHEKHNCWVFRVKCKHHKKQLINIGV